MMIYRNSVEKLNRIADGRVCTHLWVALALLFIFSCAPVAADEVEDKWPPFSVPVVLNGSEDLNLLVVPDAPLIFLNPTVLQRLSKADLIDDGDFRGRQQFSIDDELIIDVELWLFKSVTLKDITIENVLVGVTDDLDGAQLLGQSFLERLEEWKVDAEAGELDLGPVITSQTHTSKNGRLSFEGASYWELYDLDIKDVEGIAADDAVGARFMLVEVEEDSDDAQLEERVLGIVDEGPADERYTVTINAPESDEPVEGTVLMWDGDEFDTAACVFRHGGYSYALMYTWPRELWNGYLIEFRHIVSTFKLH